jgi:hypothetical protein
MKSFKQFMEDGGAVAAAPANVAGSGAIAGIGQPPGSKYGEPGVHPKKKKTPIIAPMGRRKLPKMA